MRRTHFIFNRQAIRYWRDNADGPPTPTAVTRQEADLYAPDQVAPLGMTPFGVEFQPWKVEAILPTITEYQRWIGRRGGKSCSPKKQKSSRKNGHLSSKKLIPKPIPS